MLGEAGCSEETIATGFLHDVIEDCEGWDKARLAAEIKNDTVSELVYWVTEPGKDGLNNKGNEAPWEERNADYIKKLASAPNDAVAISCADKTSNLRDMVRLSDKGHALDDFLSRGYPVQMKKFAALDELFENRVPDRLLVQYRNVLELFRAIKPNA